MSVSIAVRPGEARHQHIGTKSADHSHHVAERDVMPAPLLKSLIRILGIAEIGDPAEALFHSVVAIGCSKLQRAQHAQHIEQVAADLVLAAFAASQSHQQRRYSLAARLEGQHASVFVVGMRDGLHQAGGGLQAQQHLLQACRAGVRGQEDRRDLAGVAGAWA